MVTSLIECVPLPIVSFLVRPSQTESENVLAMFHVEIGEQDVRHLLVIPVHMKRFNIASFSFSKILKFMAECIAHRKLSSRYYFLFIFSQSSYGKIHAR